MKLGQSNNPRFSSDDQRWMKLAIELARQGLGHVEPNPLVGCVLVSNHDAEQVIGQGFHAQFGGPHAERAAIADAVQRGYEAQLAGATAYVSLEPCCHHGKTPPCTDALLEARIARVVVAMADPFEKVLGHGIEQLRKAGVQVDVGLEESAARQLNAPFLKRIQSGRPWVIAKWAMSLDGKIATSTGHSQWISSELSRGKVHVLRSRVDAILVGVGTAVADDPLLNARTSDAPIRRALRVVADSILRIQLDSRLVQTAREYPTLLWTGPAANREKAKALRDAGCDVVISPEQDPAQRLDALLKYLSQAKQVTNLLVEGGGKLLGSLLDLHQVDQCEVFVAPKLLGGHAASSPIAGIGFAKVDEGPQAVSVESTPSGTDIHISCRLEWRGDC
jgi:diaminohydroxyphosphoribosylaminopyrimidine deaminase / 5-amino-6-(5-phosphoribosylamino)uracil reductase